MMRHHDLNITTNIYMGEQMLDLRAAIDNLAARRESCKSCNGDT